MAPGPVADQASERGHGPRGAAHLESHRFGHRAGLRLHWVRDMDYDEDRSQVRTASGPRVMASLRIL